MKDVIQEIKETAESLGSHSAHYSNIVIDLFDRIYQNIQYEAFNSKYVLYEVDNLLEIFNPAKKEDIKILELLKEKLERLNKVVL